MFKATRISPVLAAVALLLLISHPASGQTGLFNVPTTEVVGKNHFYIEADFDGHLASYVDGGWHSVGFSSAAEPKH